MILTETPISVLQKHIEYLNDLIDKLMKREGIRENAPQEEIISLILDCEKKIKLFKVAIRVLHDYKI